MKPYLSVALATFNESENLERCLDSIKTVVDEIVVVDGSSTDNTREIAGKFGAKVIKTSNKPIFHINKQIAVDTAQGKWILALDADEEITPTLANEISSVIRMTESEIRARRHQSQQPQKWHLFDRHLAILERRDGAFDQESKSTVAFFIPRLNMFLGHPMKHGGVYPDGVIRLFKKNHAKFPAQSVHEQLQVNGRVDWLENDLIHYDSPTFEKYLHRANRYTSLTAQELNKKDLKINLNNTIKYIIAKPLITFMSIFVRHKGFMDGIPGLIFSIMSGLHWSLAYMKYWVMKRHK